MVRAASLIREALVSGAARPVPTLLTASIVAIATVAVLLTAGYTVGAERNILKALDNSGTRSVTLTAPPSAGIDSSIVDRLQNVSGVEWVGAFGPAFDMQNANNPDGAKVAARPFWSSDPIALGIQTNENTKPVWASVEALDRLGMVDGTGSLISEDGEARGIDGSFHLPKFLSTLSPTVLFAEDPSTRGVVSLVVVTAQRPSQVGAVTQLVTSVTGATDQSAVKLTTSEELAKVRNAVEGHLGEYGRELILGSFAITAVVVAGVLLALVIMRRRDFGRRRALGATRSFIVALLLLQTGIVASFAATAATIFASAIFVATKSPLPHAEFTAAIGLLMTLVATGSAIPPAVLASRRDPAEELRVP